MYVYMTACACGYVRMTHAAASAGAGRVFLARRERAGIGLRRRDGAICVCIYETATYVDIYVNGGMCICTYDETVRLWSMMNGDICRCIYERRHMHMYIRRDGAAVEHDERRHVYMTAYACGYVRMTHAAASAGAGRVCRARCPRCMCI